MFDHDEVREFKRSEIRKGAEITVVVWAPLDGRPPFAHSVVISGAKTEWAADDPNRPQYESIGSLSPDVEKAFEAGFVYAERFI